MGTINTARSEARPQVTAGLTPSRASLTVKVTASNMQTRDRLAIAVEPLKSGQESLVAIGGASLYNAFLGPNSDGKVAHRVTLALPRRRGFTHVSIRAFTDTASDYCDDAAAENLTEMDTGRATSGDTRPVKVPAKQSGTACIKLSLRTPPVATGERETQRQDGPRRARRGTPRRRNPASPGTR